MEFIKRLEAPSFDNKYYIHTSKGGLNSCILITNNSVIPNCVGYAWGRFYEITNKKPKLNRGNAEDWFNYNDGYERGDLPKIGAVACWKSGLEKNNADGAGHVAIVEEIYSDNSILISESNYKEKRFFTDILKYPYKQPNLIFQGFIYNNEEINQVEKEKYTIGRYKTLYNMIVRTGPGTNYQPKKVKDLSKDGQKNATKKDLNAVGVYKKGTIFDALKIITLDDNNIWAKTYSGYVNLVNNSEINCIKF